MKKAIGIDLGTTNSCVAVAEGGGIVIIPTAEGERTTPSIVVFTRDGERLVGSGAKRQTTINADRTVRSVKRHMGTNWTTSVDGKVYNAQEVSAMILRKLRSDAESYLGETVTDAVITVPAYFNDIQRQATKDAGRIAGLNVLRIINEPTSAALAYGLDHGESQKILVYDLGGGTFDVSVIDIDDGVIEVMATAGDNHLGGDDFDERLVQWILQEFKKQNRIDLAKDAAAMQRIKEAAEQAKKELSSLETTTINLPYIVQSGGTPVHLEMTVTRAKFNELTRDLVERTAGPLQSALADAGISASQLGKVLLVGGSTRIPAVQDRVRALTGMVPSKGINPDECVAIGAAIQADHLTAKSTRMPAEQSGILLLDVTPLSLSVETVGGVATRLVQRNSTLPVHYSQIFSTAAPYQTSVDIHVLQGERAMAADNRTIGKFKLKGIERAPAGVPQIEVSFDIDTNGILKVSAKDLRTGKAQSITITANEKMSEDEIERAIREAEEYAAQDGVRREAVEVRDSAQRLLTEVDQALANGGKQIDKAEKKRVKSDRDALWKVLGKMHPASATEEKLSAIREAAGKLESSSAHIREAFGAGGK